MQDSIDKIPEMFCNMGEYKTEHINEKTVENKAQYYADKCDKNVFLNNFDEEDERAGDRVRIQSNVHL